MRFIHTETDIPAAPSEVWDILTDFHAYPEWNPFITSVKGSLSLGGTLEVTFKLHGREPVVLKPRITELVDKQRLTWKGRMLMPGILTGIHSFFISPSIGELNTFRQTEQFSGILVPFVWTKLRAAAEMGFQAMNRELKKRIIHRHESCRYHDIHNTGGIE